MFWLFWCCSTYKRLCPFFVLETLQVRIENVVRIYCVVACGGVVVGGSFTVILVIRSLRLLLATSILATLLIAYSMAASTFSSHSDSNSFSTKKLFFPLHVGVTFGGSTLISSFFVGSSSTSSASCSLSSDHLLV